MSEEKTRPSTAKTIAAIILAIVILVIAQIIAEVIGSLVTALPGIPMAVGYAITGVFYPIFTLLGVKLLCTRLLRMSLHDCKMPRFTLRPIWVVVAVIMPCLVSLVLCLTPGHWQNNMLSGTEISQIITRAVFVVGVGAGLVEEMLFRGVIMNAMEKRWNRYVAIFVPSVLFGLIHIIGRRLDLLSIIQLIIAGSIVGILFSLVTYESGNVWNSAVIHAIWNIIMIGRIIQISESAEEFTIYNYVLDTDSFLITGGDFGVEASIFAVLAYLVFAALAIYLMRKRGESVSEML